MHNDLPTVEPPTSVTAVSLPIITVSSPFVSDLPLGFFPSCQKFRKFRLRNKWNASFRVEIFWSKHRLTKLCGSSLDFEFIRECMKINKVRCWAACGQSGPLPQVVVFDRSVWSDRNLLFHVKKFSFPFVLCQAVIILSVKTEWITSICLVTLGGFHSTKKSGLHFRQLPVENCTAFSKIFKKRTTLRGITIFSETFSWKFSFHSTLFSEFLEFLVEWFAFRNFNSLWNFWKLFWEISVQFASASKFSFSWMESALSINVVPFSPYNFTGFCLFGFI